MASNNRAVPFFNRSHAVEGLRLLAGVFWFFAVTFTSLDLLQFRLVRMFGMECSVVALGLSVVTVVLTRRAWAGIGPAIVGGVMSAAYLGVSFVIGWLRH
jgi:hypothetical protein